MKIKQIDVFQVDLPYSGGIYHLSENNSDSRYRHTIYTEEDRRTLLFGKIFKGKNWLEQNFEKVFVRFEFHGSPGITYGISDYNELCNFFYAIINV